MSTTPVITATPNSQYAYNSIVVTGLATRHNLIPNPSFETGVSGWSASNGNSGAPVQSTTWAASGSASAQVTCTVAGNFGISHTGIPVSGGNQYSASCTMRNDSTVARQMWLTIDFADQNGTWLGGVDSPTVTVQPGQAVTVTTAQYTAPSGSTQSGIHAWMGSGAVNDAFRADAFIYEKAAQAGPYFDGSTAGATWDGTANASSSTMLGWDTISITRTNPDGSVVAVRGATNIATNSSDSWSGIDYEAPLGAAVSYTVNATQNPVALNSNSTFEGGTSGWSATNGTLTTSSAQAHSGSQSGLLTANGSGSSSYVVCSQFSVTPGKLLYWDMWLYKPDSWSAGVSVTIAFYTSNQGTAGSTLYSSQAIPSATWTERQASLTVPSNAAYATIEIDLNGTPPSGSQLYIDDVKAYYNAASTTSVQTSQVTIPINAGTAWLKNLSQSSLSTQVTVSQLGDVKRSARQQVYSVIGRANFVVISDVRGSRQGTMTLLTTTSTDENNLETLLASGQTLFFQATPGDGFPDLYMAAGDYNLKRPGVSTDPTRLWEISYTEVDSPSGNLTTIPGNSYLAVTNFGSYQNLLNQRISYLDVLNHAYGT